MDAGKTINMDDSVNIPAIILRKCIIFLFLPALFFFLSCCSAKGTIKTTPLDEINNSSAVKEDIFQTGIASWYGGDFHGRRTAAGEIYDMNKLTAAHQELPFNTIVEVENIENGKRTPVRINDRGPFIKGRIIDLSYKAAQRLGLAEKGTAAVNLRIIDPRNGGSQESSSQDSGSPQDGLDDNEEMKSNDPANPDKEDACCYIQAGAFTDEQNARLMLQRVGTALPQVYFQIDLQDGLFKVISGQFFSRARAEQYKSILASCGIDILIKSIKEKQQD